MRKKIRFYTGATLLVLGVLGGVFGILLSHQPQPSEGTGKDTAGAFQPMSSKWIVAARSNAVPVIDGKLDEPMWSHAVQLDTLQQAFSANPLPYEANYKLAYDEQHVFISAEIAKVGVQDLDRVELAFKLPSVRSSSNSTSADGNENEEPYFLVSIPFIAKGDPVIQTIWNPDPDVANLSADRGKRIVSGVQFKLNETDKNVVLEAAVPYSEIVKASKDSIASQIHEGDEWRFNVMHVHKLYTQPLASWIPVRNSDQWHDSGATARYRVNLIDQDRLGYIYFGKAKQADQQGSQAQQPDSLMAQNTTMVYDSYTKKRLVTTVQGSKISPEQIELYWKEPNGNRKLLSNVALRSAQKAGRDQVTLELEFVHPSPLHPGIYELQLIVRQKQRAMALFQIDRETMIAAGENLFKAQLAAANANVVKDTSTLREVDWKEPSSTVQSIMDLIPPQPGFLFVGLPEMPELYPTNLYQLSADGKSLVATKTGTKYPNSRFPENKKLQAYNRKGELVEIPYYEDEQGQRFFITAHMWYLQKSKAISQMAALYPRDPLGAAQILQAMAKAYEGYNPTVDRVSGSNHGNLMYDFRAGPPYAYWGGIWDRWWYNDLPNMAGIFNAYGYLKQTNAFEVIKAHTGEDVEKQIVDNMLKPSIEMILTYPEYLGNMSFQPWKGLIAAAKMLKEPDYIHRVIELMEAMVNGMFLSDGYWQEVTQSYHLQTVAGLKAVADQLNGWSDPPGYISPRTGKRFDKLVMKDKFPSYNRVMEIGKRLAYPDGRALPVMDSWAVDRVADAKTGGPSYVLPATRIARLNSGQGLNQMQLYLGFQPKYGHVHYDSLNMTLFAKGQELLPDLGYTHNSMNRWFALSTMSHNTVVVNSSNSLIGSDAKHGGSIRSFIPGSTFQTMRVDYESAYQVTDTYSREPWFVPYADGKGESGYMVDLFRVSGGSRHEYTLQGDANVDAEFTTGLELSDYGPYLLPPGTKVELPTTNSSSGSAEGQYPGYIYVRDVKQANLKDDQYELTINTFNTNAEAAKLNITGLLEPGSNELYLGRSPSLRSLRVNGKLYDNDDEADKYTMPKLVLRRDGTNLKSTFVHVMEPYKDKPARITETLRLPLKNAIEGAVAVQITYGDTTDIIISNPYAPDQLLEAGDVKLRGEQGFIRIVNGSVKEMNVINGALLQWKDQSLSGEAAIAGTVSGTQRVANGDEYDAIVVDQDVPASAKGKYVIIEHPSGPTTGFEIGEVVKNNGKTVLILSEHDPGFSFNEDGTSKQNYYPHFTWDSKHTFKIASITKSQ
ncbi:heparinase II/III domain-containing protein [Paenibacillus hemerocallicola]|nr:heparinase II/III family protein [Paenibacillus hemerocallicola]